MPLVSSPDSHSNVCLPSLFSAQVPSLPFPRFPSYSVGSPTRRLHVIIQEEHLQVDSFGFGCRSRTQEFPNNNPANLLRTLLRSSLRNLPLLHSQGHQSRKAPLSSSLTGQVAATMASTQRHMAADRLRCERGREWAARSKFSPNQLARYATRARQGNATPERSGISCKDHPPPPTHELKCEGPCDRRRDLRFFSKNTRKKGTNVSAL